MSKQTTKPYSAEFKERAVTLAVESDQTVAQTARELGINENTLPTWLSTYHHGGHGTQGQLNAEPLYEDLKRLKQDNALFKEERDIFKKAAAYFAVHSRESTPG